MCCFAFLLGVPRTRLHYIGWRKLTGRLTLMGILWKLNIGNLLVNNKGLSMTGSNLGVLLKERLCRVVGRSERWAR